MRYKRKITHPVVGFTLIELLVVIAIIGLLSTLAVVSLGNARSKARDARRMSYIKVLQSAIEFHINDYDHAPPSGWLALMDGGVQMDGKLIAYLPGGMPADPSDDGRYFYCRDNDDLSLYLVGAELEATTADISGDLDAHNYDAFTECYASNNLAVGVDKLNCADGTAGVVDIAIGGAAFCLGSPGLF